MKIPVLFVHNRSNYKKIHFFDCYDEKRDALTYTGNSPVIAHPPCRLWSKLRTFSTAPVEEKQLAFWSLALVRRNGGILEHPYDSSFWKSFPCPKPGTFDEFGGTTVVFDQFDFGYYTRKRTRLYIVGLKSLKDLPPMPLRFEPVQRKFSNLTQKQRSETTIHLAHYLSEIIRKISNRFTVSNPD